jgi:immune inhibitor A
MKAKWFSALLIVAMLVIAIVPAVGAASKTSSAAYDDPTFVPKEDNRHDALTDKQVEMKQAGFEAKLNGKANDKVKEVARGQFVELAREGQDPVWTVLGEFSDLKHNELPQPDRSVNNSTLWVPDFNRDYYNNLLFAQGAGVNSVAEYYIEQSSNRYTIYGDATEWVSVPNEAWTYDDDLESPEGGNAVWYFLDENIDGWYQMQLDEGKTPEQINEYLKGFDVWDRYDYDLDGNFDEPDGYIDHAVFIHAGEGNEAGGGILGDAAIWSHSWYAFSGLFGEAGPDFNMAGGVQIGDSNFWVGKYLIQPENGGVGVFAHEYGHDLGLPDLYDTAGGTNSTGFWTLMSSGSWLSDGTQDIGSKPGHMGVWEKFQLGWLNYEVAYAGKKSEHKMGPAETNTKQAQGLFVVLPKKAVVSNLGAPYAGLSYYYSGAGDNLNSRMSKPVTLAAGSTFTAKVKYSIELDWDYAYLVVSTDGGANWVSVPTNLSATTDPNGQNFGFGITGSSGGWVDLTADLSAYTGNVLVGFRYWTDTNTGGFGFMADEINVTGYPTDGAETAAGWTYAPATGFHVTNGVESKSYSHYYVAEFRQYRGYDASLKNAYNFGWGNSDTLYNKVEWYPYQDGLLISYWDTSQANNNTSTHPGSGQILPIDAHPNILRNKAGGALSNRIQTFDSTFSLDATDAVTLHFNSVAVTFPKQKGVSLFNDLKQYFNPDRPTMGVINPNTGTIIEIRSYSALYNFMQVQVRPAK